ncbi:hypothetical protein O181_076643 [Austropuccinia psidii MF-1]|uniref:Uncharacterized protein n=1 Tax=Austropuccinia psidii MF-1 TaxID=1389203 RepID=A0A9Q3FB87_9BASI|nr:hypothetical protein [Austropuccinia psidii MF-1]
MEESSSSKKALTLEEELEKEQSRIDELGQEESEEEDFSYIENDEEFQKKRMLRPQKPSRSPTPKTFATSTPGTFPRAERFSKRVDITTSTQQPEIFTIPTRKIVKIKAIYNNLNFDGSDVKDFIKESERRASIEGAN